MNQFSVMARLTVVNSLINDYDFAHLVRKEMQMVYSLMDKRCFELADNMLDVVSRIIELESKVMQNKTNLMQIHLN